MRDEVMTMPDGRPVAYCVLGVDDARSPAVVYSHGAPSNRYELADSERSLIEVGARVIALDRPGYGGSTAYWPRSIEDHVQDIDAVAEFESLQRIHLAAVSSGAPYALATAALLPSRVISTTVVAGVADFGWPGAWAGYDRLETQVMRQPSAEAADAWCRNRFGDDGYGLWTAMGGRLDDLGSGIVEEIFRQGITGYAHDMWLQARPWTFDVEAIHAPTFVFHGDADTTVPIGHGLHTASSIAQAKFESLPGLDHAEACALAPVLIGRALHA